MIADFTNSTDAQGLEIHPSKTPILANQKGEKDTRDDERSEDIGEEDSTRGEYDQDSSISFDDDEDRTASQEDDMEDWIEYIKKHRGS